MSLSLSLGLALDTSLERTCCLGKAVGRRKEPWQGLWVSPCVCGDGRAAQPGRAAAAPPAVPPGLAVPRPRAVWQGCRLTALWSLSIHKRHQGFRGVGVAQSKVWWVFLPSMEGHRAQTELV